MTISARGIPLERGRHQPVLWSIFLLISPTLLRLMNSTGALALAAFCGVVRWGVMAQTTEVAALALVQPLHVFTFALLHLASMRIITDTVPSALAGTAQTVYGLVGAGGDTAVLTILSGWLYDGLICIAAFLGSGWCIGRFQRPMHLVLIVSYRDPALSESGLPYRAWPSDRTIAIQPVDKLCPAPRC